MRKLKTFFFLFRSISANRFGNLLARLGGRDRFGIRLHFASDTWQCETRSHAMQQRHISSEPPVVQCALSFEVGQLVRHTSASQKLFTMCHKWTRANFRCLLAFYAAKWFHVENDKHFQADFAVNCDAFDRSRETEPRKKKHTHKNTEQTYAKLCNYIYRWKRALSAAEPNDHMRSNLLIYYRR